MLKEYIYICVLFLWELRDNRAETEGISLYAIKTNTTTPTLHFRIAARCEQFPGVRLCRPPIAAERARTRSIDNDDDDVTPRQPGVSTTGC